MSVRKKSSTGDLMLSDKSAWNADASCLIGGASTAKCPFREVDGTARKVLELCGANSSNMQIRSRGSTGRLPVSVYRG